MTVTPSWLANASASTPAAAGADGLIVEVHPTPEKSISDANQTICPDTFARMVNSVRAIEKTRL